MSLIVSTAQSHFLQNRVAQFFILVGLILLVAIGHIPLIETYTTLVGGLPLWLWIQLGVVGVLLGVAWIATGRIMPIEEQ